MTSVLISIQPKWCELIASGEKTVEVRKNRPRVDMPFKCYIYCTNGKPTLGRCLKDNSLKATPETDFDNYNKNILFRANGKVIGEFVCNYIEDFKEFEHGMDALHRHIKLNACLSYREIYDYLGFAKCGYGWHISDLVIYDYPKELSEFYLACDKPKGTDCSVCYDRRENRCKSLKRPPQSWCYVEVLR